MMRGTEGNLQALVGGLRLKVRIQHPDVHERTDRGGSYWYFRYWDDVLQPDGTTKAVRKFQTTGPRTLKRKLPGASSWRSRRERNTSSTSSSVSSRSGAPGDCARSSLMRCS